MFKKFMEKLKRKREQRQLKHHLLLCEKFWQIARAVLQYYTDYNATHNGLHVNPINRTNQELKEKIKTEQDLIYWHKKLIKSGFHYQRGQRCY